MMQGRRILICICALAACTNEEPRSYQGYAEGEYVRVAAPFSGTLQVLSVKRGGQVKAGEPLFTLEQEKEAAARREAQQRLQNAEAQLANLQKGKRPTEINAIRAQLAQAEASLTLSATQLQRPQRLPERGPHWAPAGRPARPDEIKAAGHNVEAARAALAQAEWKLDQKSVEAPVAGLVQDTYYVTGEWVSANQPVVSLLPPENIKVRFFVEQLRLGAVRIGPNLALSCDGCAAA